MAQDEAAHDYEPVLLTAHCNRGAEVIDGEPPVGSVQLRGLPFVIGDGPHRCFVCLGGESSGSAAAPWRVNINRDARWLIVAHRQLSSEVLTGGPVGVTVARYDFTLADGTTYEVPIRERFEISDMEQLPALAVQDALPQAMPRFTARFNREGGPPNAVAPYRRLMAGYTPPTHYDLWAWPNPRPGVPVSHLTVTAFETRFLIAGITIGHLEEHPLVATSGAVPVRIELPSPLSDADLDALSVTVDRGTATLPHPLIGDDGDVPVPGWGRPLRRLASPAYVQVSGLPSALVTVALDGQQVGQARLAELLPVGAADAGAARLTVVESGRSWVHTTVVDADTGQPVPSRVSFRSAVGLPYQPHGHHAQIGEGLDTWHAGIGGDLRLGAINYAYIDGQCEGWLPHGEVIVEAACGFEYEPTRTQLTLAPDQRQVRIPLRRLRDLNAEGWYSGDTHVHFLSTVGSQLEARGEGLNVVNLLAAQWGNMFTDVDQFTGTTVVSPDRRTLTRVGQENRQHFLGHLNLLGLTEPVYPLSSDGPVEAELGGTLEVTLSELADRCHAQGGTVVSPHMPWPNGELAAMVATGRVDAVEMTEHEEYSHLEYYRYLNAGYRMPLVGGTDKMSPQVPVGLMRTYVRIPDDELGYDAWCRNLQAGRTFATSGPLLMLRVDGHDVGDTVRLPPAGGTVEVHAWVDSVFPVHSLQIVVGGSVVDASEDPAGTGRLSVQTTVTVKENTWIAARAGGPGYRQSVPHNDRFGRGIMAHTSPVYVACGQEPWTRHDDASLRHMITLVDISRSYVDALALRHLSGFGYYGTPDQQQRALTEPLDEAVRALRERLERSS
jgi:hypothetical protein